MIKKYRIYIFIIENNAYARNNKWFRLHDIFRANVYTH